MPITIENSRNNSTLKNCYNTVSTIETVKSANLKTFSLTAIGETFRQQKAAGTFKDPEQIQKTVIFNFVKNITSISKDLNKLLELYIGIKNKNGLKSTRCLTEGDYTIVIGNDRAYLLIEQIGEGDKKVVFKGINLLSGELIAVSRFSAATAEEFEANSLKSKTFKKWRDLSNSGKGLVPLLDSITVDCKDRKIQYVVQKFCSEGDLRSCLNEKTCITAGKIKTYAEDLFCGVGLLIKERLYHADIKPENILLHEGHAYLADPESVQVKISETFNYASPKIFLKLAAALTKGEEVNENDVKVDEKAVVWSLGLTSYFLFSHEQAKVSVLLEKILGQEEKKRNQSLSNMTTEIFKKLLPWEINGGPSTIAPKNGKELIEKMLRVDSKDCISFKEAFKFLKAIPTDQIVFKP